MGSSSRRTYMGESEYGLYVQKYFFPVVMKQLEKLNLLGIEDGFLSDASFLSASSSNLY